MLGSKITNLPRAVLYFTKNGNMRLYDIILKKSVKINTHINLQKSTLI